MAFVRRVGQACLATVFVSGGLDALRDPGSRAGKAKPVADALGVDGTTLVRANAAAMVAGGLALATDHLPRTAAAGLAASLVPTTLTGHPFWTEKDRDRRRDQRVHFAKNVSLFGACVILATSKR
ncbi:MAG TPA: DoxX family membrane protein [Frankiaceae bacterium]|jgi:uncharacterized membrane protein YphA (DoxX/SURF4 family)|nr:DoxX family membrane protein [Frankiaceae bacterium]